MQRALELTNALEFTRRSKFFSSMATIPNYGGVVALGA